MVGVILKQEKNMKQEKTMLHVLATDKASVLPVGSLNSGRVQFIGKETKIIGDGKEAQVVFEVIPGGVLVPYHSQIIDYLKKGSLLALNVDTAIRAGVQVFVPELNQSF